MIGKAALYLFVGAMALSPPADAGWFSDDPQCPAASAKELESFAQVRFIHENRSYWKGASGETINTDNALRQTITLADVDRYAAYLKLVRENVAKLDAACLREAYSNVIDTEERVIEKTRRALKFIKTPSPTPAGS